MAFTAPRPGGTPHCTSPRNPAEVGGKVHTPGGGRQQVIAGVCFSRLAAVRVGLGWRAMRPRALKTILALLALANATVVCVLYGVMSNTRVESRPSVVRLNPTQTQPSTTSRRPEVDEATDAQNTRGPRRNVRYLTYQPDYNRKHFRTFTVRKVTQQQNVQQPRLASVSERLSRKKLRGSHSVTRTVAAHRRDTKENIRVYALPPWFTESDLIDMHRLAEENMTFAGKDTRGVDWWTLGTAGETSEVLLTEEGEIGAMECKNHCVIVDDEKKLHQVFAFHLDRVLGINRTLPMVARSFTTDNDVRRRLTIRPVSLWDPSILVTGSGHSSMYIHWNTYQQMLKSHCWGKGPGSISKRPKGNYHCTDVLHSEWCRMAMLDFLLQIYDRLDRSCCGFHPTPSEPCVLEATHSDCQNDDRVMLDHILQRRGDTRHLVLVENNARFNVSENRLNYRLLEGIDVFPKSAVALLKTPGRLRQNLVQSLFTDRQYWEASGGRHGVERLIDVIEARAKALLRHMKEKKIRVAQMH
ncbi:PREDICTED: protein FAM198B-like [Branchiostoma belcheri]|uniref:Protein FAM198B-like n=1 Tax=Branchiostoma belcheri TaxID=7741 RepID=A0A6P4YCK8_BRABE|nr:PREDICTED: protein FAM198B-like [Branchiostoma belcheri]